MLKNELQFQGWHSRFKIYLIFSDIIYDPS